MRITRLGHACLLIEAADRRILIDPGNFSRFTHVRDLDAILVTHHHLDHFDPDEAAELISHNPGATVHTDPATAQSLHEAGLRAVPTVEDEPFTIGDLTISPVGVLHAFNHAAMPQLPNVGYVLRAEGEPTLFHPGDAYDAEPGEVDVLAHPLNAPWAASRESIAFVARIAPRAVIPIHDALLSPAGRRLYAMHIKTFSGLGEPAYTDLGDDESATF